MQTEPMFLKQLKSMLDHADYFSFLAQEVSEDKYTLLVIDQKFSKSYFVRHYRHDDARTWNLSALVQLLKRYGVFRLEVRSLDNGRRLDVD